jgi:hypothetical protein
MSPPPSNFPTHPIIRVLLRQGKRSRVSKLIYRHPHQLPPFWYFTNKTVCFIITVWLIYRVMPEMTFRTYCTTITQLLHMKETVYAKKCCNNYLYYKYIIIIISIVLFGTGCCNSMFRTPTYESWDLHFWHVIFRRLHYVSSSDNVQDAPWADDTYSADEDIFYDEDEFSTT